MNEKKRKYPPTPPTPAESHEVEEEQRPTNSIAHTTCLTLYTIVFVDKLPQNIIRCKAYGIPNAQNKTREMLNDQPDDDCHKSKHVALMLYLNASCVDGNIL